MKLSTPRTIANCVLLCRILLFSVAPVLALTTALLTANTIAVPGGPEATNVGGEPPDASATFTNRASTLTIELLSLLTAAQTKKDLGEVFFTLDNTRGSGSVSSSTGTLSDFASRGGAVPVVSSTLSNPVLTGQAHSGSHYWFGTEDDIVGPYFKANASIAGNAPHDLIVQGTGEFGLSIAGLAQAGDSLQAGEAPFEPFWLSDRFHHQTQEPDSHPDPVSAVPEPGFDSLLFAGIITAALVYRRRSAREQFLRPE